MTTLEEIRAEAQVSAFAQAAPQYRARGWKIHAIIPGEKRPGYFNGRWIGQEGWQTYEMPPDDLARLCRAPGNAGVGARFGEGTVGIDIDVDDPAIIAAVKSVLPPTPLRKRGEKGETLIFRCRTSLPSVSFNDTDGKRVLDILSARKQSVMPPSMHPSGVPYVWTGTGTCATLSPEDLPLVSDDVIERLTEVLAPLGVTRGGGKRKAEPVEQVGQVERARTDSTWTNMENPWRTLNDIAIASLDKWVPQLPLYRCQRTRDGYQAVATWRPSNSGNPPEKRKLNLKIHPDGIVDFGDGPRGYSPCDLVMAAFDCEFIDAYEWLKNVVDPCPFVIDLDAIAENMRKKSHLDYQPHDQ